MSELQFAPLSEFADVTMGQSPDATACNTEERGLPFLQGCAEFGATHPDTKIYCAPPLRVAKSGSVLISVRAPVGTMNYADQDYCVGRGLGAFKAKPGLANTIFLKHAVELNSGYLHRRSQGSTFAAVSTTDVRSVPVPAFSPLVQSRIASFLSCIDTAIEKTESLIAKHQQIKAGLMHDLFTHGVLPNGQLRPPRSEAPELYQETALGWIPQDWKQTTLARLCSSDITYGIVQAGPHVESGVPYIRTGDMAGSRLVREDLLCTSSAIAASYRRSEVKAGDIVIAIRATVGKVLPVPQDLDGANLTQGTARISGLPGVDMQFLLWAIRHDRFQKSLMAEIKGTTFFEITLKDLRRLPIAIPETEPEQALIAQRMSSCEEAIRTQTEIKEKLQKQKLGLMQDLLTGRVPVPAAPEPAEAAA